MSRNKKAYRKIREVLKGIISNMGSVILILALCTIVIAIIINWKSVVIEMQRFIKVIMPFIFGLVLAFLINPLVESIQKILNRLFFRTKHKKAWHFDTPEKISTLMYFIKILLQNNFTWITDGYDCLYCTADFRECERTYKVTWKWLQLHYS